MPDTGWFSSPFFNDNKQRLSVTYKYDSLYRETERVFGNGVVQKTQYTVTGQTELITEVNSRGELLRAEGYVYDEGGRRIYTISEKGELTGYTYDTQSRLSKVLYPYTDEKKEADKIEAEEEGVHYLEGNVKPVNVFLSLEDKALIVPLLEKIGWGRSSYLTTTQVLWQETYSYDANGNRASKTTPFGTIRYWYDKENRLEHSGSDEGRGSDYTYDANGNLLTKTNLYKSEEYEYNLSNRMKKSVVTDQIKKTKTITHYDYDAFGRPTLVQDEGGKIIRTLYDGLSFDIIREQETFADGYFTNTSDTGIAWGAVSEGDGSRYRYIGDDAPAAKEQNGYSVTATNRSSSRVALYANGQAVGVTRSSNYASSERSYFGTDLMGTVRSSTTDSGSAEYYEYDVFGKPYGESVSDYAYTGKPYDPVTGMYNYGYRDYVPQTARFSTIDPIRDGSNWFAYCNNEPVNFLDVWGLEDIVIFSAIENADTPNNIGYVLLVDDWYEEIQKAAEEEGLTVRIVSGTNATKEQLKKELENDETKRLIIVAHGDDEGNIYDQKGAKIDNAKKIAGTNLEIIDVVACYASTGADNWGNGQDVRTYNPGSSTQDPKDDDEIWWNQTNEAINKKIPESIRNNGSDTSGDPNVKPDPFTKKIVGSQDPNNQEEVPNGNKNK